MTMSLKTLPRAFSAEAIVYYASRRRLSPDESREQRRQYDQVGRARQGLLDVDVIDDDLGRTGSGTVARPGFGCSSRICARASSARTCAGRVRLARNGRDRHHC